MDIEGEPRHQVWDYNGIEYRTGTITYKVTKIVNHIPRYNTLYDRTVKCIYNGQPKPERYQPQEEDENDTETNDQNEIDTQIWQNQTDKQQTTEINDNTNKDDTEQNETDNQQITGINDNTNEADTEQDQTDNQQTT